MRRMSMLIVLTAILMFAVISMAQAADDCNLCHGSVAKVGDFVYPQVSMVTNQNVRCYQCHAEGLHTFSYNSTNTLVKIYFTDLSGQLNVAYFRENPDMVSKQRIHELHSVPDERAGSCKECHLSISCNTCHETVPHALHSVTKYQTVNIDMSAGQFGGLINYPNSCVTSECHGAWSTPFIPVVLKSDGQQLCLNCHTNDLTGHKDLPAKHAISGSLTSQTTELTCSQCHQSSFDLEHEGRISKTTGATLGCATCHNDTYKATVDQVQAGTLPKNCDACHDNTARHSSYPNSHVTDFVVDKNGMDCSTCHKGDLRQQHMAAGSTDSNTSCDRCHKYAGNYPGLTKEKVANAIATDQTNCDACHVIHADVTTVHDLAGTFTTTGDTGCITCHSDKLPTEHSGRTIKDGAYATTTIATENDSCKLCHNSLTDERSLAVKTAVQNGTKTCDSCHQGHGDIDTLHDNANVFYPIDSMTDMNPNKLNCSDCHATKLNTEHANRGYDCAICHNYQGTTLSRATIDSAINNNDKLCSTCHAASFPIHSQVSDKHVGTFPTMFLNCTMCHSNILDQEHMARKDDAGNNYDCSVCHGANVRQDAKDAIKLGLTDCTACHPVIHPNDQLHVAHTGTFFTKENYTCTECHKTDMLDEHAAQGAYCDTCHQSTVPQIQTTIANMDTQCISCHSEPWRSTAHSGDETIHAAATTFVDNPSMDCSSCHQTAVIAEHLTRTDDSGNAYTCSTCHKSTDTKVTGAIANRTNGPIKCSECHDIHSDVATLHNNPTFTNGDKQGLECAQCHSADLSAEHAARKDVNGVAYNCATCHNSTRAEVQTAITTNNKDCMACHATRHEGVTHDTTYVPVGTTPELNCSSCHTGGKLTDVHVNKLGTDGQLMTCATCHASTNATVQTAITNNQTTCEACHATKHEGVNHTSTYAVVKDVDCSKCHAADVTTVHVDKLGTDGQAMTCSTCHASTEVNVVTAINANDTKCTSCHTTRHASVTHSTSYVANPELDCASCHTGGKLTDVHVGVKGSDGVAMDCNTCHTSTDATVQTAIANNATNCDACHTSRHADVSHSSTYVDNAALNCASCHKSNDLPTIHVGVVTNEGVTMNCNTCHSATAAADIKAAIVANNTKCDACHSIHTDVASAHDEPAFISGTKDMDCKSCHNSVLSEEHAARKDDSGNAYTCATCHNSTRTDVQTSIANGVKYCDACHATRHEGVDHTATVYWTNADSNCANCHSSDLTAVHVGNSLDNGTTGTCATCHSSTNLAVTAAITNGSTNCDACHTTKHQGVDHSSRYMENPPMDCSQCHASDVADIHTSAKGPDGSNYTCNTCHSSTRTDVLSAISSKNTDCDACHVIHADVDHTSTFVATPKWDCGKCHSSDLPTEHQNALNGGIVAPSSINYNVFRSTDGTNFTKLQTTSTTSLTDSGLNPGTKYFYKVNATDTAGNTSADSIIVNVTIPAITDADLVVDDAAWSIGNNGDYNGDTRIQYISPSALSRLTDAKDSSYLEIREDGSSDKWIYVKANVDPNKFSTIKLKVRATWYDSDSSGNILVYPYQSDGKNIDRYKVVNYEIRDLGTTRAYNGTYKTYEIDVTTAAHSMDGRGWMKFRIKPGSLGDEERAYVSEVELVGVAKALASETYTTQAFALSGDTTAPTVPSGLTATLSGTNGVQLTWTASTDVGDTSSSETPQSCSLCHDSTRTDVQTAIASGYVNCDACHTVHTDITTPHLTGIFPDPNVDCLKCHIYQATEFSATNASYHAVVGTSKANSSYGSYLNGFTATTQMKCTDCHGASSGTTAYANILKRTYTYTSSSADSSMLCFLCHDRATYGGGSDSTGRSGFSEGGKNLHNIGDHKEGGKLQCSWCHAAVPHGINRPHLIALKSDPAPISNGNQLTGFTHPASGSYRKSSCTSNTNMCDDH